MQEKKSISDLLVEYFGAHPRQDLPHGPVVDWVEEKYVALYGKKPRDTWRGIRKLHEQGFLIKVKKGIYRHDPNLVKQKELSDFSAEQKRQILKRDGYKCVQCGRGIKDGVELHVDHIKSKYSGGTATIENGQTLCSQHNFIKKHLKYTETGKKMFIRLYELAKKEDNKPLLRFSKEILEVFEDNDINGHIKWEK